MADCIENWQDQICHEPWMVRSVLIQFSRLGLRFSVSKMGVLQAWRALKGWNLNYNHFRPDLSNFSAEADLSRIHGTRKTSNTESPGIKMSLLDSPIPSLSRFRWPSCRNWNIFVATCGSSQAAQLHCISLPKLKLHEVPTGSILGGLGRIYLGALGLLSISASNPKSLLPVQVPVWMPFFAKRSKHPGRTMVKSWPRCYAL